MTTAWIAKNKERVTAVRRRRQGYPEPTRPAPVNCECCGTARVRDLDHDHVTGQFRGWLCGNCNKGIGLLGDNMAGILRALVYLHGP